MKKIFKDNWDEDEIIQSKADAGKLTVDNSDFYKDSFEKLCELIIEASIDWTGEDEEKHPKLKTLRTLAGHGVMLIEHTKEIEKDTEELHRGERICTNKKQRFVVVVKEHETILYYEFNVKGLKEVIKFVEEILNKKD